MHYLCTNLPTYLPTYLTVMTVVTVRTVVTFGTVVTVVSSDKDHATSPQKKIIQPFNFFTYLNIYLKLVTVGTVVTL